MVQVIRMENQTAQRAMFIANQTGSVEMGVIKSLQVTLLLEKLHNGIAHFEFIKKSTGELREAWGTLANNLVSAKVKTGQRRTNHNLCTLTLLGAEFQGVSLLQLCSLVYQALKLLLSIF